MEAPRWAAEISPILPGKPPTLASFIDRCRRPGHPVPGRQLLGLASALLVARYTGVSRLCRAILRRRRDAVFCSAACRGKRWRSTRRIRAGVVVAVAGPVVAVCPFVKASL